MNPTEILEDIEEETWLKLETESGEFKGKVEKINEFTEEQRDEISQNVEYLGRYQGFQPENSHIPQIEPGGDLIYAIIRNPFENYEIEINPMSEKLHTTYSTKEESRDLSLRNIRQTCTEKVLNEYSRDMDLLYIQDFDTNRQKARSAI